MSDYHSADLHQIAFDDKMSIWHDDAFRQAWLLARVCFTNTGKRLLNHVEDHQNFESFIRLMARDESQHTGSMKGSLNWAIWENYYDVLTPEGMNIIARLCVEELIFAISVLTEMTGRVFVIPTAGEPMPDNPDTLILRDRDAEEE